MPQEWKLVPVKLTEAMIEVARDIAEGPYITFQEHWTRMLDAAPEQEEMAQEIPVPSTPQEPPPETAPPHAG
jgi:hypothetical protein